MLRVPHLSKKQTTHNCNTCRPKSCSHKPKKSNTPHARKSYLIRIKRIMTNNLPKNVTFHRTPSPKKNIHQDLAYESSNAVDTNVSVRNPSLKIKDFGTRGSNG